jgi:hypothetical protein
MCNLRVKKLINIITFTFYCSEVFPHVTNKKRTAGNAARYDILRKCTAVSAQRIRWNCQVNCRLCNL